MLYLIRLSNAKCCQIILVTREVEEGKEYFVKWKELTYDECSWESELNIASFHKEIEKFNIIHSRYDKVSAAKQKRNLHDGVELKKKYKEFQQYEGSPDFLSGGTLCSSLSRVQSLFYHNLSLL